MTAEARTWPGLGRSIPRLGFGCWQIAGAYSVNGRPQGWGAMEEPDAVNLIHRALEEGVVFFDTAAAYGHGRSEAVLGKALASSRLGAQAVVCTKILLEADEIESGQLNSSLADRVEAGLARLGRERIDVLLIHNPPDDLCWDDIDSRPLEDLQRAGKIGLYGVSARSLKGAIAVARAGFGTCLEWVFHLLERRPAADLFPLLTDRSMAFIARSPLSRGLLSPRGLQSTQIHFKSDDFRSTLPADWLNWTRTSLKPLARLADTPGGMEASALRFCLSSPPVSMVIPGIKKPQHLESLRIAAAQGPLDGSTLDWIDRSAPAFYPPWA